MKQNFDSISVLLRLTLGVTFLLNGSAQSFAEVWLYFPLIQTIIGVLLIFGAFTKIASISSIVFNLLFIALSPLLFKNPLSAVLQLHQVIAQIGVATAIFVIGASNFSLDKFFFPFKAKKEIEQNRFENLLAYSLAMSFALTFVSVFLFISDQNYVLFEQWKHLVQKVQLVNMPILASFIAVATVMLFFNFGRRTIAFGSSILFLLALAVGNRNYEVLPLLGLSLSIALFSFDDKKLKIIPKRTPKEYI
jgi:uncharacterized membrane protein YphA (DoxX/SURF4 family)